MATETSNTGDCRSGTVAAFTPGPWKAVGGGVRTISDAYVCELSCPRGADERDATVRLIAAAPELYEALEKLCDELAMRPSDDGPLVTAGRAALAKARGQ